VFWTFFSAFSALFAFPSEKAVVSKDRASGAYRLSAYVFSKMVVETPADCIYPIVFAVITYYAIRLNEDFVRFLVFMLILVLVVLASQSMGLAISALLLDIRRAQVVTSVIILATMLISGFYVLEENVPTVVRPLKVLSFIRNGYIAMLKNEVMGQTYSCVTGDKSHTIYSQNGQNCPVTGDDVLRVTHFDDTLSVAGNLVVLVAWIVGMRLVSYLALKYLHAAHKQSRRQERRVRSK
jgi:ABC-type transport system involved in multi-copper enzyme maturation permease subunit